MCRQAVCGSCSKVTWRGCGQHVDQVMAGVPAAKRCQCQRGAQSGTLAGSNKPGLFRSLFGRREK